MFGKYIMNNIAKTIAEATYMQLVTLQVRQRSCTWDYCKQIQEVVKAGTELGTPGLQ